MEQNKDIAKMLDLMVCPAFAVKDGIIESCNYAAKQLMIEPGSAITGLLVPAGRNIPLTPKAVCI